MKRALIINGDTESRHLGNVDMAALGLKGAGYAVMAISPSKPSVTVDRYIPARWEKITPFMDGLPSELSRDDDLVIYTTGHGYVESDEAGSGTICIDSDCRNKEWEKWLNQLPYHQRVVVMDQCFSGNWKQPMLSQHHTLFISAGSKGELDSCVEFAPPFWKNVSVHLPTWNERFENVFLSPPTVSRPVFMASADYVFDTPPPFPDHAVMFATKDELDVHIRKLKPDQIAVVMFSAPWCHYCQLYSPKFDAFAKQAGGEISLS